MRFEVNESLPRAIPDHTPGVYQELTFTVAGAPTVTFLELSIHLPHTWIHDIYMELESPLGTIVYVLASDGGSYDGLGTGTADTDRVVFRDDATNGSIHDLPDPPGDATIPIEGTWASNPGLGPFSDFAGENPNGTWTLRFADQASGDVGSVDAASLFLNEHAPVPGGGPPPPIPSIPHEVKSERGFIGRTVEQKERIRKIEIGHDKPEQDTRSVRADSDAILEWLYRGAGQWPPTGMSAKAHFLWEREQELGAVLAPRLARFYLGLMPGAVRSRINLTDFAFSAPVFFRVAESLYLLRFDLTSGSGPASPGFEFSLRVGPALSGEEGPDVVLGFVIRRPSGEPQAGLNPSVLDRNSLRLDPQLAGGSIFSAYNKNPDWSPSLGDITPFSQAAGFNWGFTDGSSGQGDTGEPLHLWKWGAYYANPAPGDDPFQWANHPAAGVLEDHVDPLATGGFGDLHYATLVGGENLNTYVLEQTYVEPYVGQSVDRTVLYDRIDDADILALFGDGSGPEVSPAVLWANGQLDDYTGEISESPWVRMPLDFSGGGTSVVYGVPEQVSQVGWNHLRGTVARRDLTSSFITGFDPSLAPSKELRLKARMEGGSHTSDWGTVLITTSGQVHLPASQMDREIVYLDGLMYQVADADNE